MTVADLPDKYKIKKMRAVAALKNRFALPSVSDQNKNKEMFERAVEKRLWH